MVRPRLSVLVLILVVTLLLLLPASPGSIFGAHISIAAQQPTLEQLEAKLQEQYAAVEKQFADGPSRQPTNPRKRLRLWQEELARSFAVAGATVEEIIKLHPANEAMWHEPSETLWFYAQPPSPPEKRSVFGASEVQKRARLLELPLGTYPDEAAAAKANGNVRLHLVLAADGNVKYIFPTKSEPYRLTEAAMEAAHRVKFEPAVRNGQPVSQFAILVYEFKKGESLRPYVPAPIAIW